VRGEFRLAARSSVVLPMRPRTEFVDGRGIHLAAGRTPLVGAGAPAASGSRSWCHRRGCRARRWRPPYRWWPGRRRAALRTAPAAPRSAGPGPGRAKSHRSSLSNRCSGSDSQEWLATVSSRLVVRSSVRLLLAVPVADLGRRAGTGPPESAGRDPVCQRRATGAALSAVTATPSRRPVPDPASPRACTPHLPRRSSGLPTRQVVIAAQPSKYRHPRGRDRAHPQPNRGLRCRRPFVGLHATSRAAWVACTGIDPGHHP
jgi:hypothetical protein